ncbi:putative signal peptide protein [Puccinia sorghi]|uniref:Putative signal peptide protein n=1 Tax=Puccinia sorghi TaxID=27349 RepID=A0A0L6VNQ2_9BASI|nr:putative signal peptide protein [Puccinia sorghi]
MKSPVISSFFFSSFFPECMSYLIWELVLFIICASHTFNSIAESNSCTALYICVRKPRLSVSPSPSNQSSSVSCSLYSPSLSRSSHPFLDLPPPSLKKPTPFDHTSGGFFFSSKTNFWKLHAQKKCVVIYRLFCACLTEICRVFLSVASWTKQSLVKNNIIALSLAFCFRVASCHSMPCVTCASDFHIDNHINYVSRQAQALSTFLEWKVHGMWTSLNTSFLVQILRKINNSTDSSILFFLSVCLAVMFWLMVKTSFRTKLEDQQKSACHSLGHGNLQRMGCGSCAHLSQSSSKVLVLYLTPIFIFLSCYYPKSGIFTHWMALTTFL